MPTSAADLPRMRQSGKTRATIAAAALLGVASGGPSWGEDAVETISVRIYDYADLPAETVSEAATEATRVLAKAGIDVKWVHCPASPLCAEPLGAEDLKLEILSRKHAAPVLSSSVLGYAVLPRDGSPGVLGGVLYGRIEPLIPNTRASVPKIVGHVAAHEIGHLLLGSNTHPPRGLMAAQITGRDFDRAAQGALLFSPDEAERLRAGARGRQVETFRIASAR